LNQGAQARDLVELKVEGLEWTRAVGISYRKGAYLSPAARHFMELIRTA
jgi:hypothetical protein